jgi:hypothetical protein
VTRERQPRWGRTVPVRLDRDDLVLAFEILVVKALIVEVVWLLAPGGEVVDVRLVLDWKKPRRTRVRRQRSLTSLRLTDLRRGGGLATSAKRDRPHRNTFRVGLKADGETT